MEHRIKIRERRPAGQRPIQPQTTSDADAPAIRTFPTVVTFRYAKRIVVCAAGWTDVGTLRTVEFECPLCWTRILACAHGNWITADPLTGALSIPGCLRCAPPCPLHLHVDDGSATEFPSILICARDGNPW